MSKRAAPAVEATNQAQKEQAQQGPTPGAVEGVVDQDRLDRLDALAEKATAQYGGQPEPETETPAEDRPRDPETGQFIHRDPPAAVAETPAEEVAAAEPEQPEPPKPQFDLSIPITRKVNGVDVTKTADEWIAAGQKTEAADRYLAEASKAFKTTREPAQAQAQAESPSVEDDNLAIARAIQTGTEEEAAKVIARIRASQPPAVKPEQLAPIVQEQVANFHALQTFQAEFKDVVGDPNLLQVLTAENAKLLQAGYAGSNLDRLREAGERVRKWRDGFQQQATSEKQQRKATVTPLPTAAARAQGKTEEKPESARDVIADMAKQRMAR